jgi:effector-binding domain-containing protein
MIETPKIVTLPSQITAKIHLVIPSSQVQQVMGKTLAALNALIRAQGVGVAGPWFTHHLQPPGKNFDFEICIPVAAAIKPSGKVLAGERPAMDAARTVYRGSYEGLGGAWRDLAEWLQKNGHSSAEDLYESYLVGIESLPTPADWQTALIRPVVRYR